MARTAREVFAHDAVVAMQDGESPNALGGAITKALCGGWDHPAPCPLAPHYVSNVADGKTATLRVVFATQPENEQRVRGLIDEALASGQLTTHRTVALRSGNYGRWLSAAFALTKGTSPQT